MTVIQLTDNPRAVIGGNGAPADETSITRAAPVIEDLRTWLRANPVIVCDTESRAAKAVADRVAAALAAVEAERDGKVRPLNEQVRAINAEYHALHNTNSGKPGLWDKMLAELRRRMTTFARAEEERRHKAAEAARIAAEHAKRLALEAEAREREAIEDAGFGVETDAATATATADAAFAQARRAKNVALRAERDTKVRIVGGAGSAVSLRNKETLAVADWRAAIEEMGLTVGIADAILTAARSYRKALGELPAGITATIERSL